MKNSATVLLAKLASNICTKMAFTVSASACYFGTYQPEEPKCLRKN